MKNGESTMSKMAFTLIELLIVVAIIGILAAIAVPNFLNAQIRAKISKTESEMNSYHTAAEMYRLDNGDYHPHNHTSWQNKYLTTPIAYFAAVPRDIFENENKSNAWNLKYGEYHLERIYRPDGSMWLDPKLRVPNNPEAVARGYKNKPYSYELWSVGPNGVLDFGVNGIVGFTFYETSNGLTSIGDIVWIRP
jgi:type II secretion system protein G